MSNKASDNKRTVYILFVPGGAMLGIVPAMVLSYLEELTETPAAELFQAMDGVSTGSIIVSASNAGIPAKETTALFCNKGSTLFPFIPNRELKMLVSNGLHYKKGQIDPVKKDSDILGYIDNQCDAISEKLTEDEKPLLENIRKIAFYKWINERSFKKLSNTCGALKEKRPEFKNELSSIEAIFALRTQTSALSSIFKRAAIAGMDAMLSWADQHAYDEKIAEEEFKSRFGTKRMSDCKTSVYISTYDAINNRSKSYYSRKKDLFDPSPDAERITSRENALLYDATMASTSNPFAYPPHITEDGTLCIDKAVVHTPIYCINDILANKPDDADVKLVILGTGKKLPPKQDLTKKDLMRLRDEYKNLGVMGNLIKGNETSQLESYTISMARKALRKSLGEDNIIEISPKLYPTSPLSLSQDELENLPDKNPLNASRSNVKRIIKLADNLIEEQDQDIRKLAFMLVENLYKIGQIDQQKFERVAKNIGIEPTTETLESRPKTDLAIKFEKAIEAKHQDSSFRSRFTQALKRLFNGSNDDPKPPPPSSASKPKID